MQDTSEGSVTTRTTNHAHRGGDRPDTITDPRRAGSNPAGVADEPLIDIRQLAGWLKVSEHTVKKWCAKGPESGLIPRMIRLNGQLRFRPQDVRQFIASKEIQ